MNIPSKPFVRPPVAKPAAPAPATAVPQSAVASTAATSANTAATAPTADSVIATPPVVLAPEPTKPAAPDPEAIRRAADQRAWERRKVQDGQEAARRKADLDRREGELRALESSLQRFQPAPEPAKALPAEVQAAFDAQARELAELKEWRAQQMRERQQQAATQTFEQALTAIEAMAKESASSTPTVAELAKKDPKRFRAACTRVAREDPTLQDDEILGMIEDELTFYGGLTRPKPATEAPPAPSDSTTAAKPPPATPVQIPQPPGGAKANNLALMRAQEKKRTEDALAAARAQREARLKRKV